MIKKITVLFFIIFLLAGLFQLYDPAFSQSETSKIGNLKVELNKADFQKASFDKLFVNADDVDFEAGMATNVFVKITGFHRKELILDEITAQIKELSFITESLKTRQELQLTQPVAATGTLMVTERGINTILNQRKVLEMLSNLAQAKINQFGIPINAGVISFNQPRGFILANNKIKIDMMASIAGMLTFPVSYMSTVSIVNSHIQLTSPEIITSGIGLPTDIAEKLNEKLNSLMDLSDKTENDLDLRIDSIQMVPGEKIVISGKAILRKLYFGKRKETVR